MIISFFLSLMATLLPPQAIVMSDDLGTPFTLAEAPRRIVSLAPNITEILFALGLGDQIVGVTRYCDYPAPALQKEKIGGMVDPNLERIQALRPASYQAVWERARSREASNSGSREYPHRPGKHP